MTFSLRARHIFGNSLGPDYLWKVNLKLATCNLGISCLSLLVYSSSPSRIQNNYTTNIPVTTEYFLRDLGHCAHTSISSASRAQTLVDGKWLNCRQMPHWGTERTLSHAVGTSSLDNKSLWRACKPEEQLLVIES